MRLANHVDDSNKDKALLLKGLPWGAKWQDIVEFFKSHVKLAEKDIHLERFQDGKMSGRAVVMMENAEQVKTAK